MISFYPGPSRIQSNISGFMLDACNSGILSENHRSEAFVNLSSSCIKLLKQKLHIPEEYSVFFTSSATECWQILATSFLEFPSFHIFNGSFGEKWYQNTQAIKGSSEFYKFGNEDEIDLAKIPEESPIFCITHNETSNGTEISNEIIQNIKKRSPISLVMVDATSSMGGMALDFSSADVWFASVQKCFGLPAGLGILICSQKAVESSIKLGHKNEYNSLINLHEKMMLWQTPHTPNVLGIYLLMRVVDEMEDIYIIDKKLKVRANEYYNFFSQKEKFQLLIKNKKVRSNTVIALKSTEQYIKEVKHEALKNGILLGNGYGELSKNTLRIANFPSILSNEIDILKEFLKSYLL